METTNYKDKVLAEIKTITDKKNVNVVVKNFL